ncbi:MAG: hypothetical protein HYZ45_02170 [Burkholderiales bacterium]|nr:hypothetical protein [Burkholderiales bacterium]
MKFLTAMLSFALIASASAQNNPPGPPNGQGPGAQRDDQRGERRGPPAEFLAACKGKKEGDVVKAKSPRGDTVQGRCTLMMIPEQDAAPAARK